jgi:hypothetical protein
MVAENTCSEFPEKKEKPRKTGDRPRFLLHSKQKTWSVPGFFPVFLYQRGVGMKKKVVCFQWIRAR